MYTVIIEMAQTSSIIKEQLLMMNTELRETNEKLESIENDANKIKNDKLLRESIMNREQAEKAIENIIKDLSDRRGLSSEWDQIDDDIQEEIRSSWVSIILKTLSGK